MKRLKPENIDHIINLIEQIADASDNIRSAFFFTVKKKKKPILSKKEIQQLQQERMFLAYEKRQKIEKDIEKIDAVNPSISYPGPPVNNKEKLSQNKNKYDPKVVQAAKDKLSKAQTEYFKANIEPLQKQLKQHFCEHRTEILQHSSQGDELQQSIEAFINYEGEGNLVMIFFSYPEALFFNTLITLKNKVIPKLKKVETKLESEQEQITAQQKQVVKSKLHQEKEKIKTATKLETIPVTLTEFIKDYCEGDLSDSVLDSRKKSLLKANLNEQIDIKLPNEIGKWKRGKPKFFDANQLKEMWPEYRQYNPNLPPLKSTQQ